MNTINRGLISMKRNWGKTTTVVYFVNITFDIGSGCVIHSNGDSKH